MPCPFCGSAANVVAQSDRHIVRDAICGEYRISGSAQATLINYRDWHIENGMQNELKSFAINRDPYDVIHSEDLSKAGLVPSYDGPGDLREWNQTRVSLGLSSVKNPD